MDLIKKTITDNNIETLEIKWDGNDFALAHQWKYKGGEEITQIIVISIPEWGKIEEFAKEQIKHG